MMLRVPEMRKAFLAQGFMPVRLHTDTKDFDFSRPSSTPDLFEIVHIKGAVGGSHAMAGSVGLSVVRGEIAWKGLTLTECKTPRGNEAGWFDPASHEDAKAWLEEVVSTAPALAAKMIAEQGPKLLGDTAEARAAAKTYLHLSSLLERSIETSIAELRKRATADQAKLAERLIDNTGIINFEGGDDLYLAAALSMVVFGEEVEGRKAPFDIKAPVMDRPFAWRIQIVADRLLRTHGLQDSEKEGA
jgi:hypothetical protein